MSDYGAKQERGNPKGAKKRRQRLFVYRALQTRKVPRLSWQGGRSQNTNVAVSTRRIASYCVSCIEPTSHSAAGAMSNSRKAFHGPVIDRGGRRERQAGAKKAGMRSPPSRMLTPAEDIANTSENANGSSNQPLCHTTTKGKPILLLAEVSADALHSGEVYVNKRPDRSIALVRIRPRAEFGCLPDE